MRFPLIRLILFIALYHSFCFCLGQFVLSMNRHVYYLYLSLASISVREEK